MFHPGVVTLSDIFVMYIRTFQIFFRYDILHINMVVFIFVMYVFSFFAV